MQRPPPEKALQTTIEERRRARWSAFWTPFITMASVVGSVALLMFFAKTCRERFPQFSPNYSASPLERDFSTNGSVEIPTPAQRQSMAPEGIKNRRGESSDGERTTPHQ